MLTDNDVKEHLALAYVYAVATRARCSFDQPRVDRDSIDVKLGFRNDGDPEAVLRSPELALQVKACTTAPTSDADLTFFLKRKNHHDLVKRAQTPRLLVVVHLPSDPAEWLHLSEQQLVLRRCGYWLDLKGHTPTMNETGETVRLPRHQIFDPPTLERLMRCAARQEDLR
ncbi:DUF4365 domain-containing protein [Chondromyces crocatus]|uniref:DUF4365 domain-containing protein n=1 Tax=Chondromyces crocatus TaxID=52 RepID=A0A0K1E9E5_CHOCO|nr:DUF4365 domain-containing protein [Chondromyces crocatus]AKT37193.1 uncharacterized protein CMC5_013230 [Chondromyces crocatus]